LTSFEKNPKKGNKYKLLEWTVARFGSLEDLHKRG